jgi:ATP adenylyltransferase
MQQLHAYWRMSYIQAPKSPSNGQLFTDLPASGNDRKALIVHRSSLSYLVLNRFPYNPGHLLAVPFRPAADPTALTPAERADLMDVIALGQALLEAAVHPDGFNIGFNLGSAAGSSIRHLHAHIVPRWTGDTNFMPVVGRTRVLPQALKVTYERLVDALPGVLAAMKAPAPPPRRPGRKRPGRTPTEARSGKTR